jgi:hypothetical protein
MNHHPARRFFGPDFDRTVVETHFRGQLDKLRGEFHAPKKLAPVTKGSLREDAVKSFLRTHLPPSLVIGSGHILHGADHLSRQQDIVVASAKGVALPLGDASLFVSNDVVACVEVKSVLTKEELLDSVAKFDGVSSSSGRPPLKVVFARRIDGNQETVSRDKVLGWLTEMAPISESTAPDMIIALESGTVVRRTGSEVLTAIGAPIPACDYMKLAPYGEAWTAIALLVFEIAKRGTNVSLDGLWQDTLLHAIESQMDVVA